MAVPLLVVSAAGTAVSAYSQYRAGQAAEAAGEAQEKAAQIRAQQQFDEGRERSFRMRQENQRRLASIRAQMGARGTTISGSAVDFLAEAARRLELGVQDQFRSAVIGAGNDMYSGRLSAWEGTQRKQASTLRAFGTLLEGASATYEQGVNTGAFNPYQSAV